MAIFFECFFLKCLKNNAGPQVSSWLPFFQWLVKWPAGDPGGFLSERLVAAQRMEAQRQLADLQESFERQASARVRRRLPRPQAGRGGGLSPPACTAMMGWERVAPLRTPHPGAALGDLLYPLSGIYSRGPGRRTCLPAG